MNPLPATLLLMSEEITTAQTAAVKTAAQTLSRAKSIAFQCNFTYGSGGTSAKAYVQTTFDDGTTWVDIACFAHTTSSLRRCVNLNGSTSVTTIYTATDGSLTDDTVKDGLIGSQLRVKFTSVGTYAGSTTMVIKAVVRA
jgi:hypothetical protein